MLWDRTGMASNFNVQHSKGWQGLKLCYIVGVITCEIRAGHFGIAFQHHNPPQMNGEGYR